MYRASNQTRRSAVLTSFLITVMPFVSPLASYAQSIPGVPSSTDGTGANLDLSSGKASLSSQNPNPVSVMVGGTVNRGTVSGGSPMTISPGQLVTPAQHVAVFENLQGNQTLLLNGAGSAAGGSFNLNAQYASNLSGLVVPSGVTINAIGYNAAAPLNISGAANILGSVFSLQNAPNIMSVLNMGSLNVGSGGILSGQLPSSLMGTAGLFSSGGMQLNIAGDLVNQGTITSPGVLNIIAGGSISNQSVSNVQAVISAQSLSLVTGSGNVLNSGLIQAANSINFNTINPATNLKIANTGGLLQALGALNGSGILEGGTINLRDGGENLELANVNLFGGTVDAPAGINVYGKNMEVHVDEIKGPISNYGSAAHVSVKQGNLTLGSQVLSGDPTYYNSAGNVTINSLLSVAGDLAIVASDDIVLGTAATTIQTQAAGNSIFMSAGYNFTVSPVDNSQSSYAADAAGDTTNTLSFTGTTNAGKNINAAGKQLELSTTGSGTITLMATGDINMGTTGAFTAQAGDVLTMSNTFSGGNGGSISTTSGAVTISSRLPSDLSGITILNGTLSSTPGISTVNDVGAIIAPAISSTSGTVTVDSAGPVTLSGAIAAGNELYLISTTSIDGGSKPLMAKGFTQVFTTGNILSLGSVTTTGPIAIGTILATGVALTGTIDNKTAAGASSVVVQSANGISGGVSILSKGVISVSASGGDVTLGLIANNSGTAPITVTASNGTTTVGAVNSNGDISLGTLAFGNKGVTLNGTVSNTGASSVKVFGGGTINGNSQAIISGSGGVTVDTIGAKISNLGNITGSGNVYVGTSNGANSFATGISMGSVNSSGDVKILSNSGNITTGNITAAGEVQVRTTVGAGDVTVGNIDNDAVAKPVTLDTMGGKIAVGSIDSAGDITIGNVAYVNGISISGNIDNRASSTGSKIMMQSFDGGISGGNDLFSDGDIDVLSFKGNVTFDTVDNSTGVSTTYLAVNAINDVTIVGNVKSSGVMQLGNAGPGGGVTLNGNITGGDQVYLQTGDKGVISSASPVSITANAKLVDITAAKLNLADGSTISNASQVNIKPPNSQTIGVNVIGAGPFAETLLVSNDLLSNISATSVQIGSTTNGGAITFYNSLDVSSSGNDFHFGMRNNSGSLTMNPGSSINLGTKGLNIQVGGAVNLESITSDLAGASLSIIGSSVLFNQNVGNTGDGTSVTANFGSIGGTGTVSASTLALLANSGGGSINLTTAAGTVTSSALTGDIAITNTKTGNAFFSGKAAVNVSFSTTGNIQLGGNVTGAGDITLSTGAGGSINNSFGSFSVESTSGQTVTINADVINITGAGKLESLGGTVALVPSTTSNPITIGTGGAYFSDFSVINANNVQFGNKTTYTGNITTNDLTVSDFNLNLFSASGNYSNNGNVTLGLTDIFTVSLGGVGSTITATASSKNISADVVSLQSGSNIGTAVLPFPTSTPNLSATTNGSIDLSNIGDVDFAALSGSSHVKLLNKGNIAVTGNVQSSTGGISLLSGQGGGGAGISIGAGANIISNGNTITFVSDSFSTSGGKVDAGSGLVSFQTVTSSQDFLVDSSAVNNITAGTIEFGNNSTYTGNIFVTGDITVGSNLSFLSKTGSFENQALLTVLGGTLSVNVGGFITNTGGAVATASNIDLDTTGGGIGTGLAFGTQTSGSYSANAHFDIALVNGGSLSSFNAVSNTGAIALFNNGDVTLSGLSKGVFDVDIVLTGGTGVTLATGSATLQSTKGHIDIATDKLTGNAVLITNKAGESVTLRASSAGRTINIAGGTGGLDLSAAQLGNISTPTLIVGSATGTGAVIVGGNLNLAGNYNLELRQGGSGGSVSTTGQTIGMGGNNLTIAGGKVDVGTASSTDTIVVIGDGVVLNGALTAANIGVDGLTGSITGAGTLSAANIALVAKANIGVDGGQAISILGNSIVGAKGDGVNLSSSGDLIVNSVIVGPVDASGGITSGDNLTISLAANKNLQLLEPLSSADFALITINSDFLAGWSGLGTLINAQDNGNVVIQPTTNSQPITIGSYITSTQLGQIRAKFLQIGSSATYTGDISLGVDITTGAAAAGTQNGAFHLSLITGGSLTTQNQTITSGPNDLYLTAGTTANLGTISGSGGSIIATSEKSMMLFGPLSTSGSGKLEITVNDGDLSSAGKSIIVGDAATSIDVKNGTIGLFSVTSTGDVTISSSGITSLSGAIDTSASSGVADVSITASEILGGQDIFATGSIQVTANGAGLLNLGKLDNTSGNELISVNNAGGVTQILGDVLSKNSITIIGSNGVDLGGTVSNAGGTGGIDIQSSTGNGIRQVFSSGLIESAGDLSLSSGTDIGLSGSVGDLIAGGFGNTLSINANGVINAGSLTTAGANIGVSNGGNSAAITIGAISTSAPISGIVQVNGGGPVTTGSIDAQATGSNASSVIITSTAAAAAGDININGPINASGAATGGQAGGISVVSAKNGIVIGGAVSANGFLAANSGGSIVLQGASLQVNGAIDNSSSGTGISGNVTMNVLGSGNDLEINASIPALNAITGSITSSGRVVIQRIGGNILLNGIGAAITAGSIGIATTGDLNAAAAGKGSLNAPTIALFAANIGLPDVFSNPAPVTISTAGTTTLGASGDKINIDITGGDLIVDDVTVVPVNADGITAVSELTISMAAGKNISVNEDISISGLSSTGTFTTDAISINSPIKAQFGTVIIQPVSASSPITLGTAGSGLVISASQIPNVTAGTLVIGSSAGTGGITVNADVNASNSNLTLLQGSGPISTTGSTVTIGFRTLELTSSGAVSLGKVDGGANNGTVDVTGSTITFNDDISLGGSGSDIILNSKFDISQNTGTLKAGTITIFAMDGNIGGSGTLSTSAHTFDLLTALSGGVNIKNSGAGGVTLEANPTGPLVFSSDNQINIGAFHVSGAGVDISTTANNGAINALDGSITANSGGDLKLSTHGKGPVIVSSGRSLTTIGGGDLIINSDKLWLVDNTTSASGESVQITGQTVDGTFASGGMVLDNWGTVQANSGNITVASAAGQDMTLTGVGGSWLASTPGSTLSFTATDNPSGNHPSLTLGPGNQSFTAGDGSAAGGLVFFTAAGDENSTVGFSSGGVSYGFPQDYTHVVVTVGKFSGNPSQFDIHPLGMNPNSTLEIRGGSGTIANSLGDIDLSNLTLLNFTGPLAIFAAGDIISSTPLTLGLPNLVGVGGTLTMIAGYNFTPATAGVVGPTAKAFTLDLLTSTVGGKIDLSLATINTSGKTGGGNVFAVANPGSAAGSGTVTLGSVNTQATSSGKGGNVIVYGTDLTFDGNINTSGPGGAGSYTAYSGIVITTDGTVVSGGSVVGGFTSKFVPLGSNNGTITVNAGKTITAGDVSISANTINLAGGVNASSTAILTMDSLALSGSLSSPVVLLQTATPFTPIAVAGSGGSGTLDLLPSILNSITATDLIIGNPVGSPVTIVGDLDVSSKYNLDLRGGSGGAISIASAKSLNLGTKSLSITTSGAVIFDGSYTGTGSNIVINAGSLQYNSASGSNADKAILATSVGGISSGGTGSLSADTLILASAGDIGVDDINTFSTKVANSINATSAGGSIFIDNTGAVTLIASAAVGKTITFLNQGGDLTISNVTGPAGVTISMTPADSLNNVGIISTSNAPVNLVTDNISLTGSVNTGIGAVTILPQTTNRTINLGTATGGLDFTAAELNTITAGSVTIGSTGHFGNIVVSGTSLNLTSSVGTMNLVTGNSGATAGTFNATGVPINIASTGGGLWVVTTTGSISTAKITNNSTTNSIVILQTSGGDINLTDAVGSNVPVAHDIRLLAGAAPGTGVAAAAINGLGAGPLTITPTLSGNNGGNVFLRANNLGTITGLLTLNVAGTGGIGNGGIASYERTSNTAFTPTSSNLVLNIGSGTSGNQGTAVISNGGDLTFNPTGGAIVTNLVSTAGDGAKITLTAGSNNIGKLLVTSAINANGTGAGNGGSLTLNSNSTTAFIMGPTSVTNGVKGTLSVIGTVNGDITVRNRGGGITNSVNALTNVRNLTFDTTGAVAGNIVATKPLGNASTQNITLTAGGNGTLSPGATALTANTVALTSSVKAITASNIIASNVSANMTGATGTAGVTLTTKGGNVNVFTSTSRGAFSLTNTIGNITTLGAVGALGNITMKASQLNGSLILNGNLLANTTTSVVTLTAGTSAGAGSITGTGVIQGKTLTMTTGSAAGASIGTGTTLAGAGALNIRAINVSANTVGDVNLNNLGIGTSAMTIKAAKSTGNFTVSSDTAMTVSPSLANVDQVRLQTTGANSLVVNGSLGNSTAASTTTLVQLVSGGNITGSGTMKTGAAGNVDISNPGNIGTATAAFKVNTPVLTVPGSHGLINLSDLRTGAGVSVNSTLNASGTLTFASSGGAIFNGAMTGTAITVKTAGSTTINGNVTASGGTGSINIIESAGLMTINSDIFAQGTAAQITLQEKANLAGTGITFASGSSLTTDFTNPKTSTVFPLPGMVRVIVGGSIPAKAAGTQPGGALVVVVPGSTPAINTAYWGTKNNFVVTGTNVNTMSVVGNSAIQFQAGSIAPITFNDGVNITADPPVAAAALPTPVALSTASVANTGSVVNSVSVAISRTSFTRNPITNAAVFNQATSLPSSVDASVPGFKAARMAVSTQRVPLGAQRAVGLGRSVLPVRGQLQGGVSEFESIAGHINASVSNEMDQANGRVIAPSADTTINTPFGDVDIAAKSVALLFVTERGTAVFNLADQHRDSIKVRVAGRKLVVNPGRHVMVSERSAKSFDEVNVMEPIAYRGISETECGDLKVFHAEFSIPSAIAAVKPLKQLFNSAHPEALKLSRNLAKTVAAMQQLNRNGERFQQILRSRLSACK